MSLRRLTDGAIARVVILLVAGVFALGIPAAQAQDRVTLFLHGFGAEASDWAGPADQLRDRVRIDPKLPEFDWRQPFQAQASQLQSGFGWAPSDTLLVGHSNGGLLAREFSRVHQADGIVTIGTPHRGAPVIPHFYQWANFQSATEPLLNRVLGAFSQWNDWAWIYWYIEQSMDWVSNFSIWSVFNLAATLGVDVGLPVANDMVPASPYLLALNSGGNLEREASQIPNRVGIVSVAHNFYYAGPARAIAPDDADEIATLMYGAAYGMLYWSGYLFTQASPTDVAATDQSLSMLGLAGQILSVDPFYCQLVSRMDMSECHANDGLVPDESQAYPNAANFWIGLDNDGPAHKQEKQRGGDAFYDALVWYMHIPPRVGGAPPAGNLPPPPPPPPPSSPGGGGNDPAPSPPPPPVTADVVTSGRELHAGETVDSANGMYHLAYQGDGNLVLYDQNWQPMWASNTVGLEPNVAAMQGDGNFVIYEPDWTPVWASGDSWGHPGAYLVVQNDGNLVIYDPDGTPLWATGTVPMTRPGRLWTIPARAAVACALAAGATVPLVATAPTLAVATAPREIWHVAAEGRGSPVVDADSVYFLSKHHTVYAISRRSGRVRWARSTGEPGETTAGSTIALAGPLIVAGDYAVVAFDRLDGTIRWRFEPDDGYAPGLYLGTVIDGVAFAGSPAGRLYAVDASSGDERWSAPVVLDGRTTVLAPAADARIVAATFTTFSAPNTGGLAVFDRSSGRERWRVMFPRDAAHPVGTASAGGPLIAGDRIIAASGDGTIYAFSRDGVLAWSIPPESSPGTAEPLPQDFRALASSRGALFAGSLNGTISAFDLRDRHLRWRHAPSRSSVAFALTSDDQSVYVPYLTGQLVALDIDDGAERWRVGDGVRGFAWPACVSGGSLYLAGSGAGFFAFNF